jgi:hypothetical protein
MNTHNTTDTTKVLHSFKVPCSVHIEGVDWYKAPMYRFFQGPKPTFLGAILFKRQMQLLNKLRETQPAHAQSGSATVSCSQYSKGGDSYCNTCGRFHKINGDSKASPTVNKTNGKTIDISVIKSIQKECETLHTTLPKLDSALIACATNPHLEFDLDEKGITTTVKTRQKVETITVNHDDFIAWCMVPDDSENSKKLDELMDVYFKSTESAHPPCSMSGSGSDEHHKAQNEQDAKGIEGVAGSIDDDVSESESFCKLFA